MKLLKVIFFLIPFLAFGQYQNSPNKAVLGNQTTGKGLIYYGSGAPAYTPTTNKNAYHYVDTTTDVFWHWDFTSMLWDTVTVSGGGGGGTDSQVIDTFTYASDTLRLSMSGDGQMYKYVVIPGSSDDQNIDTFSIVSDTIRLSLQSDGQKYKYVNLLPYKDNTDTQTIYWNSATGNLTIYGGNTVSLDGRYLTTEADGSITNELQTIDTFSISSNTVRLSLSSDGQAYKTIDLSPYLDNTDSQNIDTLSYSSDTLRVSLSGDGQKYKSVYLPADTDDQSLSYGTKTGNTIPLNITGGSGVNLDQGTNIEITRDASNYITFKGTTTIDTFSYGSDTIKISLTNDGQATKKIYVPQISDTDDQTLSRNFDTIFISQGNYIILPVDINTDNQAFDTAQISSDTLRLSLEGDLVPVYKFNLKPYLDNTDSQTIDTFEINSNTLRASLSGDGQAFKTVSLSPYLDNTDSQVVDTFSYSSDTLRLSVSGDGQKYKTIYLPNITDTDDQYIDTLQLSGNTLGISLQADGQALKTLDLSKYIDTTFAQNGTRISNDSLYWGSQSSSTDNGSTLIHDTYIWQGGNDITFFNNGDGPDKPSLYLSAVNDVWIGANSTSTAGTAGAAGKPSVYLRYGSSGAYSFGVNNASNLNALGAGAVNFGINGLASGSSSKNFSDDGIASSTHSINMGRSGEAKTDSYAWNSGAFGSAANFAAWNSGYDGDATNYYAFNTARVGLASGYSSVNMGQSGVSSGADAKNFGNGGQVSGDHAIGFSKFNVTSGNYGINGSYYTESHAFGQSRWGYFGTDHNSQSASGWVADNILFAIDNGKEDTVRSSALTASARGWFQLRDIGTTQTNITSAKQAPKAALEIVSTESGFIPAGGTLAQRNAIWNDVSQTGNFTPTYTKGWQDISGTNIMDQNGLQFQVMNEYGGTSLYALRYNGSGYYWHQIY
jgi:hypothetical protein